MLVFIRPKHFGLCNGWSSLCPRLLSFKQPQHERLCVYTPSVHAKYITYRIKLVEEFAHFDHLLCYSVAATIQREEHSMEWINLALQALAVMVAIIMPM